MKATEQYIVMVLFFNIKLYVVGPKEHSFCQNNDL